jgi:transposase
MPARLKLDLSEKQRRDLEDVRDHHKLPYMRERAAAILKIANGHSGYETARQLLNQPHWQDTIYEWVKRYQADGIAGLEIHAGRGRKPAFSPSARDRAGRPRSD